MGLLNIIRRMHLRQKLSIREIARLTGVSRNTVTKHLAANTIEPKFATPQRPSKLDAYAEKLAGWLKTEAGKSRKQRRTMKQLHADLVALGFRTAQPVAVKVLCVTLAEAQRFGFLPTGASPSGCLAPSPGITPADCRKRYEEIATKGLRKTPAPAPGRAASAFKILRTLINFAMEEYQTQDGAPLIARNPVAIIKKELAAHESKVRTRHIDRRDVGMFWHHLTTARKNPAFSADTRCGIALVMFLLLTGTCRNEGAMLTWDRVNLDDTDPANNWFHLPDPKNENPVWLPLSSQAVAVLNARKAADDKATTKSKFVFPSRSAAGHIKDTRAPLERFSTVIGMNRLSAHDLRRSFVTLGVKAYRLDIAKLELLTNHVPQGVTARHYLETSDLRDYHPEVQAIGDYIEQQALIAAGGNVVALPLRA